MLAAPLAGVAAAYAQPDICRTSPDFDWPQARLCYDPIGTNMEANFNS